MPRVIKHPEIRRAEILDAAFRIFLEGGYDNTSLNEVIARAGLSKGMFYHHFASKEALLEELFQRVTEQTYKAFEPILTDRSVDPKTQLQNVLDRGAEIRLTHAELTRSASESLLRPESQLLYQRINDAWNDRIRPAIAEIIAEGVKTGVFDTSDPEGVADLILQMVGSVKHLLDRGMSARTARDRDAVAGDLAHRMQFHAVAIGRLLGLPDDTFSIGPTDFAQRFLEALNPVGLRKRRKSPVQS